MCFHFFLLSEDKFYDREFFPEESKHRAKQQFWGVCVGKPGHVSSDELVTSCLGSAVRCVIRAFPLSREGEVFLSVQSGCSRGRNLEDRCAVP